MARLRRRNQALQAVSRGGMTAQAVPPRPQRHQHSQGMTASGPHNPMVGQGASQLPGVSNVPPQQPPPPGYQPPAPPPAAAPPVGAPPPVTQHGGQMRSDALTTYTTAVNQYRQGIVQAALSLGAPEVVKALMNDPNYAEFTGVLQGALQGNPNSQWEQLATQEKQGLLDVNQGRANNNSFYSGFRLQDRGKVNADFSGRRTSAVGDYNKAMTDALTGIGNAKTDYEAAGREADNYDLSTNEGYDPQPTGPVPGGGKKSKPRPSKKRPHGRSAQQVGGGSYGRGARNLSKKRKK